MYPSDHSKIAAASDTAQRESSEYVDVHEAAKRARVSVSFLNKLRISGDGPEFVKLGRNVRYDWTKFEIWLQSRSRRSTSQIAA